MSELWQALLDGMGAVLAFFYALFPSYGVAIIGLTVVVRLLLFPLTAKQARSMQKMQLIQPEIKRIQARYKDDRQKLNEEIMKFYKENKVNPLAGCLPLLAQMPIFFALFAVLRSPLSHIPPDSELFQAFCGTADRTVCKPKGLTFLGMNLSDPASANHGGFVEALPYFILIALVVLTGYLQFKQTQSRQTDVAQNPQMQLMGKIFPLMFAFISFSLPAGVVLYFLVSNAWQIGQQALIFGSLTPAAPTPADGASKPEPPAPEPAARRPATKKPTAGKKPAAPKKPAPPRSGNGQQQVESKDEGGTGKPSDAGRRTPAGQGEAPRKPEAKPRGGGTGGSRDGGPPTPDGFGRAQPSGSRPRPKKRRR